MAGQSNIFEEQIATGTSAYIFAGKAVHSDPDFISIADKSLKEKSGDRKKSGTPFWGNPGLIFLNAYLARSIRISLLLVINLVILIRIQRFVA